jgi:hypothetical protein
MNVVKSIWRQLVRRRLLPVAVLLVAALAAVPVVLVREPEAPIAPVVPADAVATQADDAIAEPVVAEVTPEDRARRRRVLGARKDPFEPAPARQAQADERESDTESKPEPAPKTEQPPIGGGGGNLVVPGPVEPAAPAKQFSPGTIVVRFGEANAEQAERLAVKKLEPVPDPELPLLVYLGLTKDGKRAKFLVDASVEVDGDGTCKPHVSTCETVELSVGETEFLDVIDPEAAEDDEDRVTAQYRLDLVDIKRKGDADVK